MNIINRSELDMTGFNVGQDISLHGHLELRWRKLLYVNDRLKSTEYHRTVITPDSEVESVLTTVKQDLNEQGFPWDTFELDKKIIYALLAILWTPEVLKAYHDSK